MRRADRLFELVQVLKRKRVVTAEELALALEVSKRTIYRDIRDLQATGVPIEGEAGIGYRLQRGYELPPLTFNTEELEALVLGTRMVMAWGDRSLAVAGRQLLTKVEAVLPEALRGVIDATQLYALPNWGEPPAHLEALRRAVANRNKVHFSYTRLDGQESQRTVRPLGLYFWGRIWLLTAWCELRQDFRNFRIDRIGALEVQQAQFEETEGISLAAFIRQMEARGGRAQAEGSTQEREQKAGAPGASAPCSGDFKKDAGG